MRHPSQSPPPQAPDAAAATGAGGHPSPTRRLRIALGTWVAIEATYAGSPETQHADRAPARENARAAVSPDRAPTSEDALGAAHADARLDRAPTRENARATSSLGRPAASATTAASHTAASARGNSSPLDAINAAYAAIGEVNARMHPTRPGSDLALINSTAPGTAIEVHPDTWRLLQLARRIYDMTDGVFDPCVPTHPGRLRDIEIKPDTPALICHVPVQLDLGGIAKGYAIDRAIETLIEHGCTSGLVNAGGDVRVFGDRTETILLRQRGRGGGKDTYKPVELNNAALAVSDLDAPDRPQEHQGYYNRAGTTTTQHRYAAVIANNSTIADALTKCVLLCPAATTERVLCELAAQSLDAG